MPANPKGQQPPVAPLPLSAAAAPADEAAAHVSTPRGASASYEGELDEQGRKTGHGVLTFGDGASYEGGFVDGEKSGLGVTRFADGSSHEGEYLHGMRNGGGCYRFEDGACHLANFKADVATGTVLKWSAGRGQAWMIYEDGTCWECTRPEALQIGSTYGYEKPPPKQPTLFREAKKTGIAAMIAEAKAKYEDAKAKAAEEAAEKAKELAGSPLAQKWKARGNNFIESVAPHKGWDQLGKQNGEGGDTGGEGGDKGGAAPATPSKPVSAVVETAMGTRYNALRPSPVDAKYKLAVVQFKVPGATNGGSDKGPDGNRIDSIPIANGVIAAGGACDLILYDSTKNEKNTKEFAALTAEYDALIVRINPGQLSQGTSPGTQERFDALMNKYISEGRLVWSSPKIQTQMGAKDALVKIGKLNCGLSDTLAYYTEKELVAGFKKTCAFQPRVIKQNRGSAGEGIWLCWLWDKASDTKVEVYPAKTYGKKSLGDDDYVKLMEMNDNHVEFHTVKEFMTFCVGGPDAEGAGTWSSTFPGKYLEGGKAAGGQLVDQRLLPRIDEGEVRILMAGDTCQMAVHKKPMGGGLSAVGGNSEYTYYKPTDAKYAGLVQKLYADIPTLLPCMDLEEEPLPLLWTADYIPKNPDDWPLGPYDRSCSDDKTEYTVGEFNCSCVGISKFQAVCGGEKTLADVSDEDYFDACELTDLMGVKAIEMLEAARAAPPEEAAFQHKGASLEKKLYAKFERSGKRPKGNVLHEVVALTLILIAVIVPASVLSSDNLSCSVTSMAGIEPNCTDASALLDMPDVPTDTGCAEDDYQCLANSGYDYMVNMSNYAFTVAWPLSWFGLLLLALVGRRIDRKYRKEHETMRFRFETVKTACIGLCNSILYVLMIGLVCVLMAKSSLTDLIVLVVKASLGICAVLFAGVACYESAAKRKRTAAPSLREVYQVKLDDKFQERVEGKKKFERREDKKAAKSILTLLTCGKWKPKNAVEVVAPHEEEERPDNLSPVVQFTKGRGKRKSTYRGRLNAAGLKEGYGEEEFADGNEYQGDYKNGVREGRGTVLYKKGWAQVARFVKDKPSGLFVVWNAGRVKAWKASDEEVLMYPITLEEAEDIRHEIGLPLPPIHASDAIVEKEAAYDFIKQNPLSAGAYVRTYASSLLLTLVFTVFIKLTSTMWFIVRALASLPLYGCVPRLFYLEWVVHFHQKKLIGGLDYAALRPTSFVLAPFFFCVYLPAMGINLPHVPPPGDWPDLDYDIDWPELKVPDVKMPDLALLLKLRFPDVQWPQLPDKSFPAGFKLPSVDMSKSFAALKLKFPHMKWPELPSNQHTFPDWNMPPAMYPDLLAHLELHLPDLEWPDLPDMPELPDFTLDNSLSVFQFKFPSVEFPQLSLPAPNLPDLEVLLRVRFPEVDWPTLPTVNLNVGRIPTLDLAAILERLRMKLPSFDWPSLPSGANVSFPDWNLPGISLSEMFKKMADAMPDLEWPDVPQLALPDWQPPEFALPDLLRTLQLRYPTLAWPDASLPGFDGVLLSDLGLGHWDLPTFRLPTPSMSLAALDLDFPHVSFPSIDVDMPDISGVDFTVPNFEFPNIPIPSMGFPEFEFVDLSKINFGGACLGGLMCAVLIELIKDFKDLLLVFGKAHALMQKVVLRKQRATAKVVFVATSKQADEVRKREAADREREALEAKQGSKSLLA